MTLNELKEIALHAAKGTAPVNYSVENVNDAFIDGLKELCGSVNQFMKNRYDIYDLVIETVDNIVPKKVISAIGQFADVMVVGNGQKAIFKRKVGRARAKKFLTQVGLFGVYQTFRLDETSFEIKAHAIGGGAQVDMQRMIDGAESIQECLGVITEALTDAVFIEIQKALVAAMGNMQTANKYSANTFVANEMVKLVNVAATYGGGSVIFAAPEFVAAMGADAIVPGFVYPASSTTPSSGMQGVYHPDDIDAIHNTGYIRIFRGTPVIQIPQSFTDETNSVTQINPQFAYILPTGGEKVVKVVLEGPTYIEDFKNRDSSMEFYVHKKLGVGILTYHNWCIYQNTSLDGTNTLVPTPTNE